MPDDDRYSLTELADLASVTPRTVRYYLAQGLLPAVGQSGPGSKYGDGHLARLRLIRRLQAEHLPLAEIRRRLVGLSDADIEALAATDVPPPTDSALDYLRTVLAGPTTPPLRLAERPAPMPAMAPPPGMPQGLLRRSDLSERVAPAPSLAAEAELPLATLERSQWERIALGADVELHIRRPLTRTQQKGIDRLVTIARELLEEERP
ncbi:MAG TPA: MerR family transcriptional regulator [Candidatus Limnocylindrales bacterium]